MILLGYCWLLVIVLKEFSFLVYLIILAVGYLIDPSLNITVPNQLIHFLGLT